MQTPANDRMSPYLSPAATAFGISAIVTILFSTILTLAQDTWPAVAGWLVSLAGHHWTSHGLLDVILFFALGLALMQRGTRLDGNRMAATLSVAAIVGGGALALWFLLV